MKSFDLDSDIVDIVAFILGFALVIFAEFRPSVNDRLYEFSLLAAGSGLRGMGAHIRKNDDYEDGDRQ